MFKHTKTISAINRGKKTPVIISIEDYREISKMCWNIDKHGYAKSGGSIFMHRLISKPGKDQDVDHINGNPLDNRRENLRICTHSENQKNMRMHKDNKSGYKGVSWDANKKWRAQICVNGRQTYIGLFSSKEEAALAYNKQAIKHYGEFAKLNILT